MSVCYLHTLRLCRGLCTLVLSFQNGKDHAMVVFGLLSYLSQLVFLVYHVFTESGRNLIYYKSVPTVSLLWPFSSKQHNISGHQGGTIDMLNHIIQNSMQPLHGPCHFEITYISEGQSHISVVMFVATVFHHVQPCQRCCHRLACNKISERQTQCSSQPLEGYH